MCPFDLESQNNSYQEQNSGISGATNGNQKTSKSTGKRKTKAEFTMSYRRLIDDILLNGMRTPIELARKHGESVDWVSKRLSDAFLSGELESVKLNYWVLEASRLPKSFQTILQIADHDLVRVESEDDCILLTTIKSEQILQSSTTY